MTRTITIALLLLLVAGCTALEELSADLSNVETDFPTTTRGTTSTTSAPDFFEERCKVIDDDFAGDHWEVSCRLELDWGGTEDGVYFEVRFYDEEGFQVDRINERVNLKPGRNVVTLTGYSKPFISFKTFTR
ncbi:MAG: hypothetical protein OXI56_06975 [bacterium]|nr:hypothetical protein [bacterium]MDE0601521.1 hypothetical protein [bacterium]